MPARRALILGYLSTVGDIEVLEQVQHELTKIGLPFDVAPYKWSSAVSSSWLDPRRANPSDYSHLIVVCGPFSRRQFHKQRDLFVRFSHCVWIGINLSMVEPLEDFNPFDALIERDSNRTARPDLSLLRHYKKLPVVGICLAPAQKEYGPRQRHDIAELKIRALLEQRGCAVLELDTKWPVSRNDQRIANPEQFESLCSKVDILVTTRLHGLILALKNGIPVIALDAIAGGDKVTQQANAIGWPEVFAADTVTPSTLNAAFDRCLSASARVAAQELANAASRKLLTFNNDLSVALASSAGQRPVSVARRRINEFRRRWILFQQWRKERRKKR